MHEGVEEMRHEACKPPHAHEVPANRCVSPLPTALLALWQFLGVVVSCTSDDAQVDLEQDDLL